ncbi:hypothetical protein ABZY09_17235 [Streptomyces sp. NPDC002928]|uniref:hypothetical protein n=1 Tax=Streptomyces sp. NPDC002928 TaxID=3154440 RepID=UPI0033AAC3AF
MTRWFRSGSGESGADRWFEVTDAGQLLREAGFGPDGSAQAAVSAPDLAGLREEYGPLGGQLYASVYGESTFGVASQASAPSPEEPVTAEEFEASWRRARQYRHELGRYRSGPLPSGARVTGTIAPSPWPPGRTGLRVDLGLPVDGFVDVLHLPREGADWPPVDRVLEFEVVTVLFMPKSRAPQIRLRPTATPRPGEPWPRPAPR